MRFYTVLLTAAVCVFLNQNNLACAKKIKVKDEVQWHGHETNKNEEGYSREVKFDERTRKTNEKLKDSNVKDKREKYNKKSKFKPQKEEDLELKYVTKFKVNEQSFKKNSEQKGNKGNVKADKFRGKHQKEKPKKNNVLNGSENGEAIAGEKHLELNEHKRSKRSKDENYRSDQEYYREGVDENESDVDLTPVKGKKSKKKHKIANLEDNVELLKETEEKACEYTNVSTNELPEEKYDVCNQKCMKVEKAQVKKKNKHDNPPGYYKKHYLNQDTLVEDNPTDDKINDTVELYSNKNNKKHTLCHKCAKNSIKK